MAYVPYDPYSAGDIGRQASLLESLGGATVSGLSYVGGLLDKLTGARALRGLLGGRPNELLSILPGSDTFGLTNEQNAVSGRDLLESAGILSTNQPGLDFGDVGGFLAEVALDPSAWASFGASTLGKKLLPDAAQAGLQTLGRLPQTPTRYAAGKLNDLAIRPFMESAPGRNLSALFDPAVRGTTTPIAQEAARKYSADLERIRSDVRLGQTDMYSKLKEYNALDQAGELRSAAEGVRPAQNQGVQEVAQQFRQWDDALLARQKAAGLSNDALFDAASVLHMARQGVDSGAAKPGSAKAAFQTYDPFLRERKPFLKHIEGGTEEGLKPIIKDPAIANAPDVKSARKHIEKTYGSKFVPPKMDQELASAMATQKAAGSAGTDALNQIVKDQKKEWKKLQKADPNAPPPDLLLKAQGALKNRRRDMTRMADWIRGLPDEARSVGYFDRHPLIDATDARLSGESVVSAAEHVLDATAKLAQPGLPKADSVSVWELMKSTGMNRRGSRDTLAAKLGIDPKEVGRLRVPASEAADLSKFINSFTQPKAVSNLGKTWDSFTSLFKAGVLTWPARYVRDATTGVYVNFLEGAKPKNFSDAASLLGGDSVASQILNLGKTGGLVKDASKKYPIVGKILQQRGLQDTPENATQVLRDLIYANEVVSKRTMEAPGVIQNAATTLKDFQDELVGTTPTGLGASLRKAVPRSLSEANPLNIRGVMEKSGAVRQETKFAPAKAGEELGYYVEGMNRIPLFLSELEKGVDPVQAAKKVREAQVDYRPEAFTATEKQIKRVVPFYAWQKKMIPYILKQLWDKPGGGMAQSIRAQRNLTESSDTYVPNDLRAQTAFPVGGMSDQGVQRFITGFGLPQEAALENVAFRPTFGGTLEHTLQKILGQAHPLLKAPVELALNKQFYGGRELSDLDSPTERIMRNIYGDAPDVPVWLDQMLANSPLTRATNTLRTLTDPRKDFLAKAVNLGTGIRVSDVDLPRRLEAEIRESSKELLSGTAKNFESIFVPKRTLEALEQSDPDWQPGGSRRRLLDLYQSTSRQ